MTYYEELGISPTASTDQVQEAYRTLASVLHPDRQTKQRHRAAAERQMRRLNEIARILRDPEARKRYDAELLGKGTPVPRTRKTIVTEALSTRIVWCVCLFIGFAGIFSYLHDDLTSSRIAGISAARPPCMEAAALQKYIDELENELRGVRARRRPRTAAVSQ